MPEPEPEPVAVAAEVTGAAADVTAEVTGAAADVTAEVTGLPEPELVAAGAAAEAVGVEVAAWA